jgi:hypothetical protein
MDIISQKKQNVNKKIKNVKVFTENIVHRGGVGRGNRLPKG